jgi:hypothetical protein
MYYVLFRKTENLTPDEQHIARRGGVWLHTGISAPSRAEAMAEVKKLEASGEGFLGIGCKLKVMSEEQLSS